MSWLTKLIELILGSALAPKGKIRGESVAPLGADPEPRPSPDRRGQSSAAAGRPRDASAGPPPDTPPDTPRDTASGDAPAAASGSLAGMEAAANRDVVLLVPAFKNDRADGFTNRLLETLKSAKMLDVRPFERELPSPGDRASLAKLVPFQAEARTALGEQGADLLIHGEVLQGGLRLRLVASRPPAEGHADAFGIGDALLVPHNFGSELANLIYAAVLAAALPLKPDHRDDLVPYLTGAAEQSMKLLDVLPDKVDAEQIGSIFTALGVVAAAVWRAQHRNASLTAAVAAFEKASKEGAKELAPLVMAELKIRLGVALQELSARDNDADMFEEALDSFEAVTSALDPAKHPREWGLAYLCLGNAFLARGRAELAVDDCDRATAAFDAALKVFTREKDAARWVEAMSAKGTALVTAGAIHTGTRELEAAAEVYREVLAARDRVTQPLPWAQASNSLGSAVFALAKRTQSKAHLSEAIQCFDGALSVYEDLGQTVAVGIVSKNQQRAHRLRESIGG